MRYGAAYYPEHWPEARWAEDARLMREAGFNVVRLGEFAWRRMDPQPDQFDFSWLDRAIAILNGAGIDVLLGTPTAGPPTWLVVADDPLHSRLWAWQSVAHGAKMLLFFRWRTCRFGGEQYWHGCAPGGRRPLGASARRAGARGARGAWSAYPHAARAVRSASCSTTTRRPTR